MFVGLTVADSQPRATAYIEAMSRHIADLIAMDDRPTAQSLSNIECLCWGLAGFGWAPTSGDEISP